MIELIIIGLLMILVGMELLRRERHAETFNEESGRFCPTCSGKTLNQCTRCFNCEFAVDKWGNSQCIGGDIASGPYNFERYALLYNGDGYLRMKQENQREIQQPRCSDGPSSANRIIGI